MPDSSYMIVLFLKKINKSMKEKKRLHKTRHRSVLSLQRTAESLVVMKRGKKFSAPFSSGSLYITHEPRLAVPSLILRLIPQLPASPTPGPLRLHLTLCSMVREWYTVVALDCSLSHENIVVVVSALL